MKKIMTLLAGALFIFSSCGISARYSSSGSGQRYADGIYSSSPSFKDKNEVEASKARLQELAEKTKSSQIYLFGDRKDTVMIPENMAATIKFDKDLGTSVTVAAFDPYDLSYGWYADRYRWNNAYWNFGGYYDWHYGGWYGPWYYSSIHNPWFYRSCYDPWYYGGWYDPWYGGGFFDPWYYGYRGWYDPFYGYMHPHYSGWYGGWDPYWHHHHHHIVHPSPGHDHGREVYRGSRIQTEGNRVIAGNRVTASSSGTTTRRVTTTSRSSFGTSSSSAVREALGRRDRKSTRLNSSHAT